MYKKFFMALFVFILTSTDGRMIRVPEPIKPMVDYKISQALIDSMLGLLKSTDIDAKYSAVHFFRSLPPDKKNDIIRLALIDALSKEVGKTQFKGEDEGEYHFKLEDEVASLLDSRALKLFLHPNARYSNPCRNWYLARMAEHSEVIDTLLNDLISGRLGCEAVVGEIVRPKPDGFVASGILVDTLKSLLKLNLYRWRDRSDTTFSREWLHHARKYTLSALAEFPDDDVISILDSLAKNDTYKSDERYPVRDEAQRALIIHALIIKGLENGNSDAYELYTRAFPDYYPISSSRLAFFKKQVTRLDSVTRLYPKTIYASYALGLLGSYYEQMAKTTEERSLSPKKAELVAEYKSKALSYFTQLIANHTEEDYPPIVKESNIFIELRKQEKDSKKGEKE